MFTRLANQMFFILLSILLMAVAGIFLYITGHSEAAQLLGDFGPLLVFGLALLGILVSPKKTFRIVSSDWLVDRLTRSQGSHDSK